MTIKEMRLDKFTIILDAMSEGINFTVLPLNRIISLRAKDKKVIEFMDDEWKLSDITLAEFLCGIDKVQDADLKRLYGDARLVRLQKKLTAKEK